MSPHLSNTSSPSGALAAGRISTVPSPVARSSRLRSTASAQGSNSPDPKSPNLRKATLILQPAGEALDPGPDPEAELLVEPLGGAFLLGQEEDGPVAFIEAGEDGV